MSINLTPPVNANYCAQVVQINKLDPIPKRDRIQHATIYGCRVIVGKDVNVGDLAVFFPVETQLSHELVSNINGYRHKEWGNCDPLAKEGFFEENRRVKCLRFSGSASEGYALSLSQLAWTGIDISELQPGMDFDTLNGIPICNKYVRHRNPERLAKNQKAKKHIGDQIIDGQFSFHFDTENLRRNTHRVNPDSIVDLSWKIHGTSAIFANLLAEKDLTWYEKALQYFGINVKTTEYSMIWSSRRVIKGVNGVAKEGAIHWYSEDVWGHVAERINPILPAGFTVYGEIVGYTPSGGGIQSMEGNVFDYGCAPGECEFYVYRVTQTNVEGDVIELTAPQMREWCELKGLKHVPHIYYGRADGLISFDKVQSLEDWQADLLEYIESYWVRDQDSIFCNSKVPEEGIVLRIDGLSRCDAWKCKNFRFLRGETDNLDKDVVDIEEDQTEEVVA